MKIAFYGRKIDASDFEKLSLLISKLHTGGEVRFYWYRPFYDSLNGGVGDIPAEGFFTSHADLPRDTDLFLALGGDGTFLESLTLVRDRKIPVAGINFGRLGFLTTAYVEEGDACREKCNLWIDRLLRGDYEIEKRSPLHLECRSGILPEDFYPYALNEITIQRISPVMMEIEIAIDGNALPRYWADGILIGSATGSTAYSLSIGGPIVTPDSRVLIIAPVAPHNLNIRPLIIPDSSRIEILFRSRQRTGRLTADNRSFDLPQGERITISKAAFDLDCVSVNNNFIEALHQKLLWGEDRRNTPRS